MSDRILVATRKGLFTLERSGRRLDDSARRLPRRPRLAGARTTPRDGASTPRSITAISASSCTAADGDGAWEECAAPTYPGEARGRGRQGHVGQAHPLVDREDLGAGAGRHRRAGRAVVRHHPRRPVPLRRRRRRWQLVRSLWDHPERKKWFGGGADLPGIHSICVDPRDAKRVQLGVSCGGVWTTTDGGATWDCTARGHARRVHAARAAGRSRHPGPAPPRAVPGRSPSACGCSTTTASSAPTTAAATGSEITDGRAVGVRLRRRRASDAIPTPPGSCRPSRTRSAFRSAARSSSRARATAARASTMLRDGLPQEHAYDLVYRHALDIDADRRPPGVRQHHRRPVGSGGPGRLLAVRLAAPAADLRRALRLIHSPRLPSRPCPRAG